MERWGRYLLQLIGKSKETTICMPDLKIIRLAYRVSHDLLQYTKTDEAFRDHCEKPLWILFLQKSTCLLCTKSLQCSWSIEMSNPNMLSSQRRKKKEQSFFCCSAERTVFRFSWKISDPGICKRRKAVANLSLVQNNQKIRHEKSMEKKYQSIKELGNLPKYLHHKVENRETCRTA